MIGIIGALNEEVSGLVAKLVNVKRVETGGISFSCGELNGKKTVVALSGVGKVNASMTVSLMLAYFPKIKAVINVGVAGGLGKGVRQGDMVIASASLQHDFTLNSPDVPIGQIAGFDFVVFKSDAYLLSIAEKTFAARKLIYHKGVIATGDEFISSDEKAEWLRKQFGAIACDMESGAIAHVCYKMGVKFLSVRSVSDGGDDNADMDFNEFLNKAAAISIACASDFVKEIEFNNL